MLAFQVLQLLSVVNIPNRTSFGLAMGILARLRLAKIRTVARPNSPDMPPKRTKKVLLGIYRTQIQPKI